MLYGVHVVQLRGTSIYTMGSACSTRLRGRCDPRVARVRKEVEGCGGGERQRSRRPCTLDPGTWLHHHSERLLVQPAESPGLMAFEGRKGEIDFVDPSTSSR